MRSLSDMLKERSPGGGSAKKVSFTDAQRAFVAEVFKHNAKHPNGRFGAMKMVKELRQHFGFEHGRTLFERLVTEEFGQPWSGR